MASLRAHTATNENLSNKAKCFLGKFAEINKYAHICLHFVLDSVREICNDNHRFSRIDLSGLLYRVDKKWVVKFSKRLMPNSSIIHDVTQIFNLVRF